MKTWIYSWIVYPLVFLLARLLGIGKPKIRDTLRLRAWKNFLSLRFNAGQPIEYWVHVASSGELEYAIPILQELEKRGKRVLVTYYSISAKGPVEQLPHTFGNVSLVVPLPHDGLGLMREFVALIRRQGVSRLLLMKYELWPGLLWECNAQGIKVILVDALMPSWFHRRLLHKIDGILSGYSSEVESLAHRNVHVVGDTRVERVLQRFEQGDKKLGTLVSPRLRAALSDKPTLVCGSMWPPDNAVVFGGLRKAISDHGLHCNLIWVPHELDETIALAATAELTALGYGVLHIDEAEKLGSPALSGSPVAIIVMKKGILAELYQLGQAAYVGGGFGQGVHSVWEPALCGALVACGPGTSRSPESKELQELQFLTRVSDVENMAGWLSKNLAVRSGIDRQRLGPLLGRHVGAARRIIEVCEEL